MVVTVALGTAPAARAQARVSIELWHALANPLGKVLEDIVAGFNASQSTYRVTPVFKGSYTDTLAAVIAAFRAGRAPLIAQVYDVGTATMMAAKEAVYPVYQLMRDAKVPFDPSLYLPAVRGYYSLPDGRMMSMPFNSSTAVVWYNKDAFRRAGLDPERPPRTWPELRVAAQRIRSAGAARCALSSSWFSWIQLEQFSAIHNVPFATREDGFGGLDAELRINGPLYVRHLETLVEMQREGTFTYGGRDATPDGLFPSGECAILEASSALRARVVREAKFAWGVTFLPYYPDVPGAPYNSIIGGASFWVMRRPDATPEQYRGVAEFFRYISRPEVDARWAMETGYLPVTFPGVERMRALGYYRDNPDAWVAYQQLTRTRPTPNSRGIRLGNLPQIRIIIYEEVEKAFQGKQTAKQALDSAVRRGNAVLREFQRENR
jgi:sn-glycerol 3-phosphate transport system substrate-binding protein